MANVYSFLNVNATIAGPGGLINLGAGAAIAEEGITIAPIEDKNVMTIGADGRGQHSLIASDAKLVTIRVLKTSPTNGFLMLMYNLQSATSSLWGANIITITDSARGDYILLREVAFKKSPDINYAKEGALIEWTFDAISGSEVLSLGI